MLKNVRIKSNCLIGWQSVFEGDNSIDEYSYFIGSVPAKIIKYHFTPEEIEDLLKIKWWDMPEETIRARAAEFSDVKKFIEKEKQK